MADAIIVDATVICSSFPKKPDNEIRKDSILEGIKRTFDSGIELIVVEGEEGLGKTNILAQFARRYAENTASIFIRSTSRLAYDPDSHKIDLCRQINYLISKKDINVNDVDDTYLRRLTFELQKNSRRNNTPIYFVIDGINEIPESDHAIFDIFLTMFPYGACDNFYFLFGGEYEVIKNKISGKIKSKPFILSPFSLDETKHYLSEFELSEQFLEEVHSTCRGVPGKLSGIKRILKSGVTEEVLSRDFEKYTDVVEIEWRKVDCCDELQNKVLSIAAFSHRVITVHDYLRLLEVDHDTFISKVKKITFIYIDCDTNELLFVSEPFKRFVSSKLFKYKDSISELMIIDLMKEPTSDMTMSYLPVLYEEANRFEDLISFLSLEHLVLVAQKSQSLNPLLQKASLGIKAAKELNRDGDLLRFSLQKSAVEEIDGSEIWRSEIDARMALNDYGSALALAQSTTLLEDRLHALAVIAKAKIEKGFTEEPELNNQIRQLVDQIDTSSLGERAIEIASDLIFSNPDLAMEIVEK